MSEERSQPFYIFLSGDILQDDKGIIVGQDDVRISPNLPDEDIVICLIKAAIAVVKESEEQIDIKEVLKIAYESEQDG